MHQNVDNFLQGRVIEVKTQILHRRATRNKTLFSCFAVDEFLRRTNSLILIVCGDYVRFTLDESSATEQSGLIFQVEERRTKLSCRDFNPNREHVISAKYLHLLIFMSIDEP